MIRPPPTATRTAPLVPYTTLFRSPHGLVSLPAQRISDGRRSLYALQARSRLFRRADRSAGLPAESARRAGAGGAHVAAGVRAVMARPPARPGISRSCSALAMPTMRVLAVLIIHVLRSEHLLC